ncbi:MAG: hypothetical protein HRF50_18270 [Phycisphaerae bacterium]
MNRAVDATGRARTPLRWLKRTVLGIGLASLFSDLSHETVTVLLPAFLASLGAAAVALGTVERVADGLSSAAKLYGGWLADRLRSRKRIAASGYGVMAAAPLVIAAATAWPVVLVGRALAWASRGLRTPARKALLADAVTLLRGEPCRSCDGSPHEMRGACCDPTPASWWLRTS